MITWSLHLLPQRANIWGPPKPLWSLEDTQKWLVGQEQTHNHLKHGSHFLQSKSFRSHGCDPGHSSVGSNFIQMRARNLSGYFSYSSNWTLNLGLCLPWKFCYISKLKLNFQGSKISIKTTIQRHNSKVLVVGRFLFFNFVISENLVVFSQKICTK